MSYGSDSELTYVLLGHIKEPPSYFYRICSLRPRNWMIISLDQANLHVDGVGSSLHSNPQEMYISSILIRDRGKEKTTSILPHKTKTKDTRKRARKKEGTWESESSECPPLVRYKSNKEPAVTITLILGSYSSRVSSSS